MWFGWAVNARTGESALKARGEEVVGGVHLVGCEVRDEEKPQKWRPNMSTCGSRGKRRQRRKECRPRDRFTGAFMPRTASLRSRPTCTLRGTCLCKPSLTTTTTTTTSVSFLPFFLESFHLFLFPLHSSPPSSLGCHVGARLALSVGRAQRVGGFKPKTPGVSHGSLLFQDMKHHNLNRV